MSDSSSAASAGVVRAIAFRPTDGDPMQEIEECSVQTNRGLDLEKRTDVRRNVTLLSKESWADVCRDLGENVPWWTRRANVLVEGMDLSATIGKVLEIGAVRLQIHDESKPCKVMEAQHTGLRKAMSLECRGGVFGQVLNDGTLRVGDGVRLANSGTQEDGGHPR